MCFSHVQYKAAAELDKFVMSDCAARYKYHTVLFMYML